jgi:HPr serine kinase-like protein
MAIAEAAPRRHADLTAGELWNRPAFGITLVRESDPSAAGGRAASWRHVSAREVDAIWARGDPRRTVDLRFPNGKLFLAVEHDQTLGYLVRAPRFGRHIVAPDGGTITSALPRIAAWRWERLFLAQVLPLAAVLQGLEVFHASAVALSGRTVTFVGESGVGKTSTAAHLVARGGEFVTDDVLALETASEGVLAHPGAARLSIDARELRRIPVERRTRLGPVLGMFEKRQFAPTPVEGPRQLAVIYFLQRAPVSAHAAITEVDEPRRLLGAPFIPHLRSRARLVRHLDICAQLARTARTFVIDVPPQCGARDVAGMAHEHVLGMAPSSGTA